MAITQRSSASTSSCVSQTTNVCCWKLITRQIERIPWKHLHRKWLPNQSYSGGKEWFEISLRIFTNSRTLGQRLTITDAVIFRLTSPDVWLSKWRSKGGKMTCIVVWEEIIDRSTMIRTANPIITKKASDGLQRMIYYDQHRWKFATKRYLYINQKHSSLA